ncbi:hypothetical protein DRP04_14850 [Archaeoglobales archaeon]|nr:MAG: hypothetical protein DRP04_14850 [Archaeoglobales archaeon]
MEDKQKLDKILSVLERPAYVEVLLCIASGKNYATAIAKTLGKKQPTVTEQLKELENLELIKPVKREKSKNYDLNWNLMLDVFYGILNELVELRKEFFSKKEIQKIKRADLKKVVPPELFKAFLKEYFETFNDLGGKRKGFDEIIFSFFNALENLENKEWKKLVEKFKADEDTLSILSNLISFEISAVEQVALMSLIEE